ncbi:hypothetical protein BJ912DRAFT_635214 [Pholiota molesta]|nr:hypothetical protein BJ912DRAFT_635214 [Pholiota molesta]
MMNGFKPPSAQQQQQQLHQQQQAMFGNASQGQQTRPPSSQGGQQQGQHPHQQQQQHPQQHAQQQHASSSNPNPANNNNAHPPSSSASPPAGMHSPYHGTKRKLAGDPSTGNPSSGMPSALSSMGLGGGGMNSGNNPSMAGLGGMQGLPGLSSSSSSSNMANIANMPSLTQMGALGGGMPGSPRIGGIGLGGPPGGAMGPPGLPRSISGDGMGGMGGMSGGMGGGMGGMSGGMGGGMGGMSGGMGGMSGGMGGGMGSSMGNMMSNMPGMPGNMGMGGGMASMGNMGVGGMGLQPNIMNGPRGSPRPQSSMGMAGLPGGMGGGAGGGGAMNMGGAGSMGMGSPAGLGPMGPMSSSSASSNPAMNMSIDIPARGQPQTPLRQGSHPPQAAPTPPHAQMHTPGGAGAHAPGTPMRQGSLPPAAQSPMGLARGGMPGGMGMGMGLGGGGMGPGGRMAPSSPHPAAGGMGGAQAMAMTPSLSASTLGSLGAPQLAASGGALAPGAASSGLPSSALSATPQMAAATPSTGAAAAGPTANGLGASPGGPQMAPAAPQPAGANYNPKTTEVTLVPLLTSQSTIPPLSSAEIAQVQGWMAADRAYEARVREMQGRMLDEARAAFSVGGAAGLQWWERGAPGNGVGNWNRWRRPREAFDVRYPRSRREGQSRSGRKGARREGLRLPRKIAPEDANRPEALVPIRIEFDVEHHKMRDTFVWNLNDPVVTPELFAQTVVEDYNLAPSYHSVIVKSIQDQLTDFRMHSTNYDGDGTELLDDEGQAVIKGTLDEEEAKWWEVWRRRVKLQSARALAEARALADEDDEGTGRSGSRQRHTSRKRQKVKVEDLDDDADADVSMLADNEGEEEDEQNESYAKEKSVVFDLDDDEFSPLSLEDIKLDEKAMHEDMRILIKLDIIVGSVKLDDQFEWDLDNPMASPEDFAEVYTQELGLGGEFKTAISHSIREQVQTYQKSLFLVGHPSDGTAVQDDDLKQSFLPSLTSGARPSSEVGLFTPLLNYLSDGDLERTEKERDKDLNKRRKRNTRGRRGIALPDREPIRTYRTPAIGFPELDAATLALAAAASAPMSRRAAAAAASLTIANMVASENGIAFTPQMPSAPQPPPQATASKDKKPKGLFKPPAYPSSVLRPRAHVVAPTPSTAADVSSMPSVPADNEAPSSSSSAAPPAQDSRSNKIITAKRQKELEREAKEKEFVDGQHPNYIDGVWHCSNCGCPESIAVGRRKGPLGDKSQCGTCGKFWHRHRRPRPVEYNSDPDFHSGIKQKENDGGKTPASKKRGAASALRVQSAALSTPAADASEPQTPTRSNGDMDRRSASPHGNDDDRGVSPISTASSASEAPLAQRVKLNGANHAKSTPTPAPAPVTPAKVQAADPLTSPSTQAAAAPPSPTKTWPPNWLSNAMQAMQVKYPNDKFEVILRKVNASSTPEWRIKCLDCPGKLYTPGPGETLSNYDVHLKNRQHRQRVNDRLSGAAAASVEGSTSAATTDASAAAAAAAKP